MTASNQFKMHGQLPLYGMTVGNIGLVFDHNSDVSFSSVCYDSSIAALPVFVLAVFLLSPVTNYTFTQTGAPLF